MRVHFTAAQEGERSKKAKKISMFVVGKCAQMRAFLVQGLAALLRGFASSDSVGG